MTPPDESVHPAPGPRHRASPARTPDTAGTDIAPGDRRRPARHGAGRHRRHRRGRPGDIAEIAAACVLSRHLLIEDIPGVGKTLLAQSIAAAVGGTFHRIQGTVDLLPGDVTGTLVPEGDAMRLRFRPGPIFAHVVVFDELNRTNPRTGSTPRSRRGVHRHRGRDEPRPARNGFLVATRTRIDMAGTFRPARVPSTGLPPSSRRVDRPSTTRSPLAGARPPSAVRDRSGRRRAPRRAARATIEQVTITDGVSRWIVELLDATCRHPRVRLGASTCGGLAVAGLARAIAVMRGRPFVVPDDVATVGCPRWRTGCCWSMATAPPWPVATWWPSASTRSGHRRHDRRRRRRVSSRPGRLRSRPAVPRGLASGSGYLVFAWVATLGMARLTGAVPVLILLGAGAVGALGALLTGWGRPAPISTATVELRPSAGARGVTTAGDPFDVGVRLEPAGALGGRPVHVVLRHRGEAIATGLDGTRAKMRVVGTVS
ncbi:MAG: AAA family ATPase [Ilumatobacteraceae bacterium]